MEQTVKDRLKDFIHYKNLSQSKFLEMCGLSSGFISGMRVSMLPDKANSIATTFPDLNIAWLMTGMGEMLLKNDEKVEDPQGVYVKKCECCAELRERIEELKHTISVQQELIVELKKTKL